MINKKQGSKSNSSGAQKSSNTALGRREIDMKSVIEDTDDNVTHRNTRMDT